jgi:hypothetical protein
MGQGPHHLKTLEMDLFLDMSIQFCGTRISIHLMIGYVLVRCVILPRITGKH